MIITKHEALAVLEPYTDMLYNCVYSAWSNYPIIYKAMLHQHTPRSKASIIHDHMVFNAREIFSEVPGIRYIESQQLFLMDIHGKILLRFKKLYDDKMPRNILTQQTLVFLGQMELPQVPSATHLVVGYELDVLQTGLRSISIACPNGTQNQWYSELEAPSTAEVKAFRHTDTTEESKKRVTAKEIHKAKENNE